MAQLTLTTSVSVTSLDGLVQESPSSAFVSSIQDYIEFTRDVPNAVQGVYTGTWSFALVINAGDVDFIAEVGVGSDYQTFVVPVGAHLLLPSTFATSAGEFALGTVLSVYTVSGTGRAVFAIGINNT